MSENTDGVVVLYTAKAKPGKEQELREALVAGVTGSRHDPGCVSYELHEVAGDPSTLVLYEQWISEELLNAHLASAPLQALKSRANELIEGGFEAGMRHLTKLRPKPTSGIARIRSSPI
jgi:quinol monooxygenase YgiN